ncbi:AAA family ATPase [Actinomyces wuliandei]|nr:AAA family ATPase [Actinomyces wuliandei]
MTGSTFSRFRLSRLKLRNYRSIRSWNLELGQVTMLVGPNGSGKSKCWTR